MAITEFALGLITFGIGALVCLLEKALGDQKTKPNPGIPDESETLRAICRNTERIDANVFIRNIMNNLDKR